MAHNCTAAKNRCGSGCQILYSLQNLPTAVNCVHVAIGSSQRASRGGGGGGGGEC